VEQNDEFFAEWKDQVFKDVVAIGMDPRPLGIELVFPPRKISVFSWNKWRHRPYINWEYAVMSLTTNKYAINLAGWMFIHGGNWGDTHNLILRRLVELKDSIDFGDHFFELHILKDGCSPEQAEYMAKRWQLAAVPHRKVESLEGMFNFEAARRLWDIRPDTI
jgi:hypothetical protein